MVVVVFFRGQEITGVVTETDAPPMLDVYTVRELVRRIPILDPPEHLFTGQVSQHWASEAQQSSLAFGQNCAQRYTPKKKATPAYSRGQLARLVAIATTKQQLGQGRSGALDRLAQGEHAEVTSDEEEGSEQEDEDPFNPNCYSIDIRNEC